MFRPEALAPTSLPTSWGLFATGGAAGGVTFLCLAHRVLEVLTALQLQIMAPSSLSSHLKPWFAAARFLQFNAIPSAMQAHLRSPWGVSKQSNVAWACAIAAAMATVRGAARISPSIPQGGFNY